MLIVMSRYSFGRFFDCQNLEQSRGIRAQSNLAEPTQPSARQPREAKTSTAEPSRGERAKISQETSEDKAKRSLAEPSQA